MPVLRLQVAPVNRKRTKKNVRFPKQTSRDANENGGSGLGSAVPVPLVGVVRNAIRERTQYCNGV